MKELQVIDISGYSIISDIFSKLLDSKIKSSPVYSGRIDALSTQFNKEMKKAESMQTDNPELTIERARLGRDFLNAVLQTIKRYYEKDFGIGSFPHIKDF